MESKQLLPSSNEMIAKIAIISDIHIDETNMNVLKDTVNNVAQSHKATALIIAGDLSEMMDCKNEVFDAIADNFPKQYHSQMMITLGNHDIRWYGKKEDINPQLISLYRQQQQRFGLTMYPETLCFDQWVNNYHFICVNSDRGCKDTLHLSEDTLVWLKTKIAEKAEPDKPIFLVVHEPLNRTHWRSDALGGFGEQYKEFENILKKYPQTVVFTGHIHNGFNVIEFIQRPFATLVDIPSLTRNENGVTEKGTGWLLSIYKDMLVFEAWNFFSGQPYPQYNQVIHLPQLSVLNASIKGKTGASEALSARAEELMKKEYSNNIPDGDGTYRDQAYYHIDKIYGPDTWKQINELRADIQKAMTP